MDELTPEKHDRLVAVLASSANELRRLNGALAAVEATLRRRQRRTSARATEARDEGSTD